MNEENNNVNAENQDNQQQQPEATFTQAQVQELLEKEVGGLKNKVDELLAEKKQAAQKAKEAQQAAEAAKEEALRKSGDVDELKAYWEQQNNKLKSEYEEKLNSLQGAVKERDKLDIINNLVGDFVDSEAGAFMLKSMVDIQDGNTMFRDFSGNVVADNVNDFKAWMGNNPHMSHFLRGTQASGGGASGGAGRASDVKTMNRADFMQLNPTQQNDFLVKKGGKVID